ncbi:hypothetical protein LOC68_17815 [Blastopirellula sp. JC732]|uniref:Uncharacterized protein n=1 Tax=Blastopirellula sediminis TaxID=2894196 RepID=A0A9X1MQ09_9BACT|nr:hypothetical protein [Blastopirellula sediminis]MCC9606447.1 hypothetical protein [Blastopirellula sediminis]MCC9630255.1 hypothetical protein [Blastopirellula sediminis]
MESGSHENPFAPPNVDKVVVTPSDSGSGDIEEFFIHDGKIVGQSPLSLPSVCLYCAMAAADETSQRKTCQFSGRTESGNWTTLTVSYSVCGACVANAQAWRLKLRQAAYCLVPTLISIGFLCIIAIFCYTAVGLVEVAESCFPFFMIAAIGFALRIVYCDFKVPKPPELRMYEAGKMALSRAGRAFLERYADGQDDLTPGEDDE